jgi:hypothetical protein
VGNAPAYFSGTYKAIKISCNTDTTSQYYKRLFFVTDEEVDYARAFVLSKPVQLSLFRLKLSREERLSWLFGLFINDKENTL